MINEKSNLCFHEGDILLGITEENFPWNGQQIAFLDEFCEKLLFADRAHAKPLFRNVRNVRKKPSFLLRKKSNVDHILRLVTNTKCRSLVRCEILQAGCSQFAKRDKRINVFNDIVNAFHPCSVFCDEKSPLRVAHILRTEELIENAADSAKQRMVRSSVYFRKREEIEIVALPWNDAKDLEERTASEVEMLRKALFILQTQKEPALWLREILKICHRMHAESIPSAPFKELQAPFQTPPPPPVHSRSLYRRPPSRNHPHTMLLLTREELPARLLNPTPSPFFL